MSFVCGEFWIVLVCFPVVFVLKGVNMWEDILLSRMRRGRFRKFLPAEGFQAHVGGTQLPRG